MKDDYTSIPRCLGGFGEINFGKHLNNYCEKESELM